MLGLPGEWVVELRGLDTSDAAQALLVGSAAALAPAILAAATRAGQAIALDWAVERLRMELGRMRDLQVGRPAGGQEA